MPVAESNSSSIAWWGAGLSTLLGVVKLYELWRDRFRVDISCNFTGNESIGNDVLIRNISSHPLILAHWELLYCSGHWPQRSFGPLKSADFDAGDQRLEPYATHTLHFAEQNYFDWGVQGVEREKNLYSVIYRRAKAIS